MGRGSSTVETGIGFFDHMIDSFARHGGFDIELSAKGDLHIDMHHTVEDTGIVLGQAFHQALDGFKGIRRFGAAYIPMDETLTRCAIDLSNRPISDLARRILPAEGWRDGHRVVQGISPRLRHECRRVRTP